MKKTINRHYRFDVVTAQRIKERCENLSITESEYVRRLILSDLNPIDQDGIANIIRGISDLGNSMNQIAALARGMLTPDDMNKLSSLRTELIALRKEVIDLKIKMQGGDASWQS